MRKSTYSLDLRPRVHRSHLRGLRDRNHLRLHMMLIADPVVRAGYGFDRQLSQGRRQRNELAASQFLRSAAFVRIDVRHLRTKDRVIGPSQCRQAQYVCRGSVENEEYLDIVAKLLPELPHRRLRVRIVSISHCMSLVAALNPLNPPPI